jgi:hypothetical protein
VESEAIVKRERPRVETLLLTHLPFFGPLISCVIWGYDNLGVHEAPLRNDPLSRFVDSHIFEVIINFVILVNCIYMWKSADDAMRSVHLDGTNPIEEIGEKVFIAVYAVEFLLRLARYHLYFFYDVNFRENWLDFFLLTLAVLFEVVNNESQVGWLRMLRILKIAKALRVLRVITAFKALRAIMTSLINSVGVLFWSVVSLAIFHFMFALVFVIQVTTYLQEQSLDEPIVLPAKPGAVLTSEEKLFKMFGSVGDTMLTLMGTSTGGDGWPVLYAVLEPTGWANQAFLLFFVSFSQVAILNIILGIFVDNAMKAMEVSKEEAAFDHQDQEDEIRENIEELCHEANGHRGPLISRYEFMKAINSHPTMRAYLSSVGLKLGDVMEFFNTLSTTKDQGTIEVDIEKFVTGCMNMKGTASGYDIKLLHSLVEDLVEDVAEIRETKGKCDRGKSSRVIQSMTNSTTNLESI